MQAAQLEAVAPAGPANTAPQQFQQLRYWFQPAPGTARARGLLVAVHGVSRGAAMHFQAFSTLAARCQCHLLAPLFDAWRYPDYQRLGRPGRGARADLDLIALIGDLGRRHGFDMAGLSLFGHSGGAQFVHRFVFAHPDLVRRYALSAAGWYTYPDEGARFPLGLAEPPPGFPRLVAPRLLSVPGRVFVGKRERAGSRLLRHGEQIDSVQGSDRRDRAARWVQAMADAAARHGLPDPVGLEELDDGAHSFCGLVRRAQLAQRVAGFLFAPPAAPAAPGVAAQSYPFACFP